MAEYGRSLAQEVQHLTAKVKTLLNAELKDICRGESLQVSGVKAALQKRIIDRMLARFNLHPYSCLATRTPQSFDR